MFLCPSVGAVGVCLSAQYERVFLDRSNVCMHLQKGQSCPVRQSLAVHLWPVGRLCQYPKSPGREVVTQSGQSLADPHHKLSHWIWAVSGAVLSHLQMGKLRQLVQEF